MLKFKKRSLIVIIFFLSRLLYSQEDIQKYSFLPYFVFFVEFNGCAPCDFFPINTNIIEIEKYFPNSDIIVYIKIADSSLVNNYIYSKIRTKNVIFVYDDSTSNYFNINSYPTLLVFNFNGNEISRFDKKDFSKISSIQHYKKFSTKNIDNTISVKYPIAIPQNQYLMVYDSIVYYVDVAKNEIGEFNLFTGDSIKTILPDNRLVNYNFDNNNIDSNDAKWLSDRLYTPANFKIALPINKEKILCLTSNVSSVVYDTSLIKNNANKIVPTVCKLIKQKNYLVLLENGKTLEIDTIKFQDYALLLLQQLKNKKYFAQLTITSKKGSESNDYKYLDNKYIFIQSDKPNFSDAELFFSYGRLKRSYGFDSINFHTLGVVDYNPKKDVYLYMNPYMGVFCKYFKSLDSVSKITPKGLLADLFSKKGNLLSFNNTIHNVDLDIILTDWFVSDKEIKIFLQPRNKQKYSECIVIDTYDLEGNFVKESILQYDDKDHILRFSLIGDIFKGGSKNPPQKYRKFLNFVMTTKWGKTK